MEGPLVTTAERWAWQDQAACKGQDVSLFFDRDGESPKAKQARLEVARGFCDRCPVSARCDDHAVRFPEHHGVWGGLDEPDRQRERRRRLAGSARGARELGPPGERDVA